MGERKLLHYLPQFIQEYREILAITDTEQEEVDSTNGEIDCLLNNTFIADADYNGISRYEDMLGIATNPEYTLDERKFTVLVKVNEQLPYTLTALSETLVSLCGENGFTISLNHEQYSIEIKLAMENQHNVETVESLLDRVLPCNLIRAVNIIFVSHSQLQAFTHEKLGMRTHEQIRKEVE